jgi:molecular chaperone GrpE
MSADEMRDDLDEGPGGETVADEDVEILEIEGIEEDAGDEPGAGSERLLEIEEPTPVGPAGERERQEVEGLRVQLTEARDRQLRLLADFDNFRKRVERDRSETSRNAMAELVRELLPVVDNLELAVGSSGDVEDLRRGVEMIARQFLEALRALGVEPVPAVGAPFDPKVHEAVQRTETSEVSQPTVVEEFRRGYLLQGRLIRPALVRVAVPPEGAPGGDGEPA